MAIFRVILNFLFKLRILFQKYGAKLFNKVRDPDTGKVIGMTPNQLKKVFIFSGLIFFFVVLVTQLLKTESFVSGGFDQYKKELTPESSVRTRDKEFVNNFGADPLAAILAKTDEDGLGGALGRDGFGLDGAGGNGLGPDGQPLPTEAECLDLMGKMKANIPLNDAEKIKFRTCLDQNIGGFTADEIALARRLLDENLSAEERELLRKLLAGELDEGTDEYDIAKNLLKGGDAAELARGALAALAAKNQELFDAFMKSLRGEGLSDEERALLQAFRDAMNGAAAGAGDLLASAGGSILDQLQGLTEDVANRELEISDLEALISEAQIAAAKAGEKLAKGLKLTPEEQAAIQRLAELQKRLQALKDLQEQRKQLLAQLMRNLRNSLARANATMQQVYPSGTSVELLDGGDECKDPTPFVAKKKKVGKNKYARKTKNEIWVDPNGRKLTPDEIRFIKLARLEAQAQKKAEDDLTNPGNAVLAGGESVRVDAESLVGDGGAIEAASLFVYKNQSQKEFQLTPDMRIPAILDSQILISDKGRSQVVRVRILDDVYDPLTNRLVIPKNAIATGSTQGFDADTAMMDLAFDKVVVGGRILDIKLQIGSADGSMGLKGQVRDTRGKFLLGAFITSFSAGALNWFSQAIIQDFIADEDNAGNAITGAALQGGSEVMTQIAELYAGDLQNAAKIYWAPKGIPIVLFPND